MAAPEPRRITDRQIRAGLIAPADMLLRMAAAVGECPDLAIVGQAGMAQNAALPDLEWFSDHRVLAAQGGIDVLLACAAPRTLVDLTSIAAAHNVHCWRLPPPGRSFAETTEIVQRHRAAGLVYRVASWWELVGEAIRTTLGSNGSAGSKRANPANSANAIGPIPSSPASPATALRPIFSEVFVRAPGPTLEQWAASLVDFGGGVLSADAYGMIEALVAVRGLPDSIVTSTGRCRRPPAGALRETEDVALAVLRYEGGGLGMIRAAWDIQPFKQTTLHHSADHSLRFTQNEVALVDATHRRVQQAALPENLLAAEMSALAAEIRGQRDPTPPQERHIAVSALLETAYLSARTGQPESPQKLYEVQKWPLPRR